MTELKALLEIVPDSYPDFVDSIARGSKKNDIEDEIIGYIERHSDAQTDEVIRAYLALTMLQDTHPGLVMQLLES